MSEESHQEGHVPKEKPHACGGPRVQCMKLKAKSFTKNSNLVPARVEMGKGRWDQSAAKDEGISKNAKRA